MIPYKFSYTKILRKLDGLKYIEAIITPIQRHM